MFPTPLASELSGASIGQLRHWSRTELLVPEGGTSPSYMYSFRDVLALRTVAKLRSDLSLQKVRQAFQGLEERDLTDHPSSYTLVSQGRTVFLLREGEAVDLLADPRQFEFKLSLADIFRPFENRFGKQVVDFERPRRHLAVREQRLGGWPTIADTRVPYDQVASLMVDVPAEQVSLFYPGVSASAARDALDFAQSVSRTKEAVA